MCILDVVCGSCVLVNKIVIDANYATLVMNVLCIDGLAKSILPSYNLLDNAKPFLKAHRRFKNIPGKKLFWNFVIPVARWLKQRKDDHFLVELKKSFG